jgi:hypothetical protein
MVNCRMSDNLSDVDKLDLRRLVSTACLKSPEHMKPLVFGKIVGTIRLLDTAFPALANPPVAQRA